MGVPMGAAMSTPLCMVPHRGPYPEVKVPSAGSAVSPFVSPRLLRRRLLRRELSRSPRSSLVGLSVKLPLRRSRAPMSLGLLLPPLLLWLPLLPLLLLLLVAGGV